MFVWIIYGYYNMTYIAFIIIINALVVINFKRHHDVVKLQWRSDAVVIVGSNDVVILKLVTILVNVAGRGFARARFCTLFNSGRVWGKAQAHFY